jgi:hypothetical protein
MAQKLSADDIDELVLSESEALRLISLLSATIFNRRTGYTSISAVGSCGTSQGYSDMPELVVDGRRTIFSVDMSKDVVKTFRSFPSE